MVIRNLPLLLALGLAWNRPGHRKFLLFTVACMAFGVVFTLVYIHPINDVLMLQAGAGRTPEEIRTLVSRWILADRVRFAVGTAGFIALLRAFRLPN